ncbi:GNAT family N-acetyltransferase [Agrococcus sp. ARC_14]|uniref:GNAT family N-acetyltransferase n=1 Tax=Agrococcus sp. ARC_14 TaxID=2919927 RepID=UPI001F06F7F3|nr:GNAT family N-acetyltransferase [Agrococcus sp. ARC_14]MCH1883150.1 GNAT family N-acetyltransferase [Agrococcus sp. ARC_14]
MIATLELPCALPVAGYRLRRATADDLASLIALLADDPIAAARGDTDDATAVDDYRAALAEAVAEPSNEIVVAVDGHDAVVATLQLTRIPGLARRGTTRLLIEAVRVGAAHRSAGLGRAMMRWAMGAAARATGCSLVQLTSDQQRVDAHRFYERLGFVGSHRGFKYEVR